MKIDLLFIFNQIICYILLKLIIIILFIYFEIAEKKEGRKEARRNYSPVQFNSIVIVIYLIFLVG